MAPAAGFEPATNWLTANCSTTELRWNISGSLNAEHALFITLSAPRAFTLLANLLRCYSVKFTVRYAGILN